MSGLKLPLSREIWQLLNGGEDQFYSGIKDKTKDTQLELKPQDPQAHVLVGWHYTGVPSVTLVIPLDDNRDKKDGRILVKDTFLFDETGQTYKSFNRDFQLLKPREGDSESWEGLFQDMQSVAPPESALKDFAEGVANSHARPFYTNKDFWKKFGTQQAVRKFLINMGKDAQSIVPALRVRGPDAESHYVIQQNKDESVLINRWVLDRDAEPGNGRIFIQDSFRFDPKSKNFIDHQRAYMEGGHPWAGTQSRIETGKNKKLLEKLNALPQPARKDAEAFFKATQEVYVLPLNLKRVGSAEPQAVWDNKLFFKSLGLVGKQFLSDLVNDARKVDSNLWIKMSYPQNIYQVRFLGGRTEILFTYLVTNKQNPKKNQILCYDRLVFKRDLKKLVDHSRYYKPIESTFSDRSLLEKIARINEKWRPDKEQSLQFIQKVYPSLSPGSITASEEILDRIKLSEETESILERSAALPLNVRIKDAATPEESKMLVEGAGILEILAKEKLLQSFDRSQGWAYFGEEVNLQEGQKAISGLFEKLKVQIEWGSSEEGLKDYLEALDLEPPEDKLRKEMLSDPLLREVMDVGSEVDVEIRDQELMLFARDRLFKGERLTGTAVYVAHLVAGRSPENHEATELLAFAGGEGTLSTKIEYLSSQFIDQVLDWKMLLAMGGASYLGALTEAGGLMALGRFGMMGRLGASGLGIAGEAAAFTGVHKLGQSAVSSPTQVWSTWKGETLHAMMLFGFMRGAHLMTGQAGQWMAMGQSISGAANFIGGVESVYLANQVGNKLGLLPHPEQSFEQEQFDALTTYLTAMVGYRVANGLSGGKLQRKVQQLKNSSEVYRLFRKPKLNLSETWPREKNTDQIKDPGEWVEVPLGNGALESSQNKAGEGHRPLDVSEDSSPALTVGSAMIISGSLDQSTPAPAEFSSGTHGLNPPSLPRIPGASRRDAPKFHPDRLTALEHMMAESRKQKKESGQFQAPPLFENTKINDGSDFLSKKISKEISKEISKTQRIPILEGLALLRAAKKVERNNPNNPSQESAQKRPGVSQDDSEGISQQDAPDFWPTSGSSRRPTIPMSAELLRGVLGGSNGLPTMEAHAISKDVATQDANQQATRPWPQVQGVSPGKDPVHPSVKKQASGSTSKMDEKKSEEGRSSSTSDDQGEWGF